MFSFICWIICTICWITCAGLRFARDGRKSGLAWLNVAVALMCAVNAVGFGYKFFCGI